MLNAHNLQHVLNVTIDRQTNENCQVTIPATTTTTKLYETKPCSKFVFQDGISTYKAKMIGREKYEYKNAQNRNSNFQT